MAEGIGPQLNLAELEEMALVHRKTRNIDGWLTELEGVALYAAAKHGPGQGVVVEIGSFKGKSTVWLASACKKTGRGLVYAIDTHQGSVEHRPGGEFASHMPTEGTTEFVFRANIKESGLEDWVRPFVGISLYALRSWSYPVRLLFIDGDHAYESAKADFLGWEKHVAAEGLVAFHDVDRWDGSAKVLDGPTRVVYEDVAQTGRYSAPIIVNHLAFVTKQKT